MKPINLAGLLLPALMFSSTQLAAQLTDLSQTPNDAGAGISKTTLEQIGAGLGDELTPDSSTYIIKRDPFRAIRRGRQIFQRKFTHAEGVGPRTNDGVGDIAEDGSIGAGLTDSCAACHGIPNGSAGFGGIVFTRPDSRDAPHLFGLGLQEMLGDEITQELRAIRDAAIDQALATNTTVTMPLLAKCGEDAEVVTAQANRRQRGERRRRDDRRPRDPVPNPSAQCLSYGSIVAFADGSVDTSAVEGVDDDLRVKPFFAEGGTWSIRDFVVGAFNAEMGMESPDPLMVSAASGDFVLTNSGLQIDGSVDHVDMPVALTPDADPDNDGVVNEIDPALVDYMEFYLLNYFRPGRYEQTSVTSRGEQRFLAFGCGSCHVPDLVINISEDAWFGKSIGPQQHFTKAIYRSIEEGVFIARSANRGISAFINPNGKVIKSLKAGESGNIVLNFPHFNAVTLFSNYGNKIFYLIIFLYMFLILILRKYKI